MSFVEGRTVTEFAEHYTLASRYLMVALATPTCGEFGFAYDRAQRSTRAAGNDVERGVANSLVHAIKVAAFGFGYNVDPDDN